MDQILVLIALCDQYINDYNTDLQRLDSMKSNPNTDRMRAALLKGKKQMLELKEIYLSQYRIMNR